MLLIRHEALLLPGAWLLISLPLGDSFFLLEFWLFAKYLPWQANPVKEEFFKKDFSKRQHASLMTSVVAFFSQLVNWHIYLPEYCLSTLSPTLLSDLYTFVSVCDVYRVSLLLMVRPVLKAVAACLTLQLFFFLFIYLFWLLKATYELLFSVGTLSLGVCPGTSSISNVFWQFPPTISVM